MNRRKFISYIKKLDFVYDSKSDNYVNMIRKYTISIEGSNLVSIWCWGDDDVSNVTSYIKIIEILKRNFNIELRKLKIKNLLN